ncbi:hypothetical protein SGQ83_12230 [Flavobacterium sp. Fl-318]|uniref:Uncharacterized protein n=1 Tax=Flavobacterium cupriresistens TaxID=2893885 RepID=A0ABU4REM2_9FLAO|nr:MULTISPECIES: hypothetical protein [unclassified Flavobacterium]MDX6190119.1 hypothetical protein [Flavobacterium sp. Fl-318]UFH42940.1 hypothetical protein LNP23_01680 [Flavobacterium sp. F-323]
MKEVLLRNLLKHKFTREFLDSFIKIKNHDKNNFLLQESIRRSAISVFEFDKLALNIPPAYFHANGDIQLYGFYHGLLKYINGKNIGYHVANEHGFIFSSFVHKHFLYQDTIITFSDYREKHISKEYPTKKIIKIGPYIHYVDSLLNNDDFKELKIRLGKTLLVFPFHSIDGVISEFDNEELLSVIEERRKDFDTILVCLYFKDIQIGRAKDYIDKGYKVVTAGHSNDAFFLNRLKSIMELSDSIISNEVGSYIAYAVYLKKTIELIRQKTVLSYEKSNENNANAIALIDIRKHWDEYNLMQDKLFKIFDGHILNNSDYEYVTTLFGLNHIKTASELYELLE